MDVHSVIMCCLSGRGGTAGGFRCDTTFVAYDLLNASA